MKEKFELYLTSADALTGSSTPGATSFNLGSVYDFAPNGFRYADSDYCYIKISYFSVVYTATEANTDDVSTILVRVSASTPNSLTTINRATGNNNLGQSQIIGVMPTNIAKSVYSNVDYDNEPVKCSNIFKGVLNIFLENQDGANMNTMTNFGDSANKWEMLICVYFDNDDKLLNY